jgi:hypothetical protein
MHQHLRRVSQKASTKIQPILPQRSTGKVVPLPGLIDYTDWQSANGVRPEAGDRISSGSHLRCARSVVLAIVFEMELATTLFLVLVASAFHLAMNVLVGPRSR